MAGEEVSSALAKAVAANPAGFPPDDLLPAALTELAADQPIASQPALSQLWHHAAVFLLARSEHPPARPGDWARPVKLDCKCADCRELERFATDPIAQVHRFAVRQDRRHHLEGMIQSKRLDMSCETDPRGRPQSLVCTKNLASYERECARHRKHLASMKKLLALSVENNAEASALNRRMREATGRRGAAEA